MPAYVSEAIEAGLPSFSISEARGRLMITFSFIAPIILLVSSLALSLQSDLVTDMSIALA